MKSTALAIVALIVGASGLGVGMYILVDANILGGDGVQDTDGIDGIEGIPGVLQAVQVSSTNGYTYSLTVVWELIQSMQIVITPIENGSRLYITYSMTVEIIGLFYHQLRITLDSNELYICKIQHTGNTSEISLTYPISICVLSDSLPNSSHIIRAEWWTMSSITAVNGYSRCLTVMEIAAS
ncbi:MAG: hypothetical protein ACTSRS_17460 [Candidatus Helarchaeota archaeon]